MSKNNKNSVLKSILASILGLIVGLGACAVLFIFVLLPDTYEIPETHAVTTSSTIGGEIDVEEIKSKDLSIHFLELGNKYTGDCTFIDVGNVEILIDAGSRANSVPTIKSYIDRYVDGALDYVIVTHAHRDHYAGFATSDSVFDYYNINTIIEFANTKQNQTKGLFKKYREEQEQLVEKCGTNIYTALECVNGENGAQREYDLGNDVKLQILYQEYYERDDAPSENDYSVCCQIVQDNSKYYLFTGDLEEDGEYSLVHSDKNAGMMHQVERYELYKAGHHGSKTSSSSELLAAIQPKHICVCCCAGSSEYTSKNENQFPTQQFIDRIAEYTRNVFVTSLCVDYSKGEYTSMNGNIVVSCNKSDSSVTINCENNSTLLMDTQWFKDNRKMPEAWKT